MLHTGSGEGGKTAAASRKSVTTLLKSSTRATDWLNGNDGWLAETRLKQIWPACASNQQIDEVTPRQREIFGANPSIIFVLPPVDDQIATHPQVAKLY